MSASISKLIDTNSSNTFIWVRDHMDSYWKADNSADRVACSDALTSMGEVVSNNGEVLSAASQVISAADKKLHDIGLKINALRNRIAELQELIDAENLQYKEEE